MAIEYEEARKLAEHWIHSWNTKDLESILTHYTEDVVLYSPYVLQRMGPESGGKVVGKDKLRNYFSMGLKSNPNIHMEFIDVLTGIEGYVILYKRESGAFVTDMVTTDANKKAKIVHAFYGKKP